jgi:hypothetical protein
MGWTASPWVFSLWPAADHGCPIPPDFLWGSVESPKFMRLSLQKAAHSAMGGAAYRKSGSDTLFVSDVGFRDRLIEIRLSHPSQKTRRMGHPALLRRKEWMLGNRFITYERKDIADGHAP